MWACRPAAPVSRGWNTKEYEQSQDVERRSQGCCGEVICVQPDPSPLVERRDLICRGGDAADSTCIAHQI